MQPPLISMIYSQKHFCGIPWDKSLMCNCLPDEQKKLSNMKTDKLEHMFV